MKFGWNIQYPATGNVAADSERSLGVDEVLLYKKRTHGVEGVARVVCDKYEQQHKALSCNNDRGWWK